MPPNNLAQLLVQLQYPGMTWVESRVTQAWLAKHGAEYDRIDFNVRLGEGVQLEGDYEQSLKDMAKLITQKRADIVAWRGEQVDLIEVKVRIAFGAMGQLLGYRALWNQEHPERPVARLIAIGRSVVQDAGAIIQAQGVVIEVFPQVPSDEPR